MPPHNHSHSSNKVSSNRLPDDADTSLTPCVHMRTLISVAADGSLTGVLYRFTHGHIAKCPPCRQTYNGLMVLRQRLQNIGKSDHATALHSLGEERWTQIEEAWLIVDSGDNGKKSPG